MAEENEPRTRRSQADKDQSRQQSRSVAGKQPSRPAAKQPNKPAGNSPRNPSGPSKGGSTPKGGPKGQGTPGRDGARPGDRRPATAGGRGGGGGKGGGPAGRRAPRSAPSGRSRATLFTWGTIGLVIVVVAVLVIVKVTSSNTPASAGGPSTFTAVPASLVQQVESIPASVYDKVGVSSPATVVTAPTVDSGQATLTIDGKPGVFYLGGEFCPYCAAERWVIVTSLARFGKFSGLGEMESSLTDAYPGTQTFTFYKTTYTSNYIGFRGVEHYSNVPDAATGYYTQLMPLTKSDQKLINTFYTTKYLAGITNGQVGIPFISVGNKIFIYQSSSFTPSILASLSRQQIASGLDDPTNPVTQAILASSNYLSASICATDGQQPAAVCTSKGVTAAAKALKLTT